MDDKKLLELIIGEKFSAQGYSYIVFSQGHKIDYVHVMTDESNTPKARLVVLLLRLNGWQEMEGSPKSKKIQRFRCLNCNKRFDSPIRKCNNCKATNINQYVMHSTIIMLEKTAALSGIQSDLKKGKEYSGEFQLLDINDFKKKSEDLLLMKGWNYGKPGR